MSTSLHNRLQLIDGFLDSGQCEAILSELRFAFWRPSTVMVDRKSRGQSRTAARVSETTEESWFSGQLRRILVPIDRKLGNVVADFRRRRESWQATRYARGGKFEFHLDAGHWSDDACGEREWTVLVYLNTARGGGSTRFPLLDVDVQPRAGRLVAWRNLADNRLPDPNMLHASMPLTRGAKYVLVTWVREKPVNQEEG